MSATARASFRAFGSLAVVATAEPAALRASRRLLVSTLRALDLACSRFRPDSELVSLNRSQGRLTTVSPMLWAAIEAALEAARMTGGLVDPTVGRPLRLAGYDVDFERLRRRGSGFQPVFEPAASFTAIELDEQERSVRLPSGVELDLGASAKAFAADRVAREASADADGAGVLVALGGDLAVAGRAPAGGWPVRLAVDHRSGLGGEGPVVAILAGGLATSGTRTRRWRTAVGELHHILDPRTGAPADTSWACASVAAARCLDANAAATASIVLGGGAIAWLADRALDARLVGDDGSIVRVGGWPAEEAA